VKLCVDAEYASKKLTFGNESDGKSKYTDRWGNTSTMRTAGIGGARRGRLALMQLPIAGPHTPQLAAPVAICWRTRRPRLKCFKLKTSRRSAARARATLDQIRAVQDANLHVDRDRHLPIAIGRDGAESILAQSS
jgi:hypothetical protein